MPKVRFAPDGLEVEVPPGTTILKAAKKAGAWMGDACGGNCACSTCHVYVRQGFDSLSEQEDRELDILDKAFAVLPGSRLGCQAHVAEQDVVAEITQESRKTYLDEHPEDRARTAAPEAAHERHEP